MLKKRVYKKRIEFPEGVLPEVIGIIKGYERMIDEADAILHETATPDGQPRGTGISDTVFSRARRREALLEKINAIDEALATIPPEYKDGVWNWVRHKKPYPKDADRGTYGRYRNDFLYEVAKKLNLMD